MQIADPCRPLLSDTFLIGSLKVHNFLALKAEVEHENMRYHSDFKVSQKAVGRESGTLTSFQK